MAEFLREKRLRWFGHVQRRDKDDATRKILQMTVDGERNRGTPKLRWRDLVRDDIYDQKPDNDRDGRGPRTLACPDPSLHTTQCRG